LRLPIFGIAVFALLLLHLWTLRSLWNPVIVGTVLVFLLWPLRERRAARRVIWVVVVLTGLWILAEARTVVYPVVAGLLLAVFLDPVVDRLEARRVPRPLAALITLLPILSTGALFLLVVVPPLLSQLGNLLGHVPKLVNDLYTNVLAPWISRALPDIQETPTNLLQPILDSLQGVAGALGKGLAGLGAVLETAFVLVLTPILGYYFLVDFDRLKAWFLRRWPDRHREDLSNGVATFGQILGRYLRGQLFVSSIVAAAFAIVFTLLGLPYALVVALAAGVLNIIPTVGFWISFALAAVACFFDPDPLALLLKVAIVFIVLQTLEGNVLTPRVLGRQLGVNPGLLLVTQLSLAVFFGVVGLILAAPLLAFTKWLLENRARSVAPGP
jgi:predicted PurR-regulated permease PerM